MAKTSAPDQSVQSTAGQTSPGQQSPGGQQVHGVSPQQVMELLGRLGSAAPVLMQLIQKFVEVFTADQGMMAVSPEQRRATAHLHGCCQAAIDAQLTALAEVVKLHECCRPDQPT